MPQKHAPLLAAVVFAVMVGEAKADTGAWQDSPEAYFMTREERTEWELVKTEDEAIRFIEAFRSRRSRDFQAVIRQRAALVDERLALGEAKASSTVRGKIVMLLGAPATVTVKHIPKTVGGSVGHPLETRKGGATDGTPKGTAVAAIGAGWVEYTFHYVANPALGIGSAGWTVVIEADAASGKDRLKYRRDKKKMDDILDAAARASFRRK